MPKKKLLLSFIIIASAFVVFIVAKETYVEHQLERCINNILTSEKFNDIEISTKDRGKKPILKGNLSQTQKESLFVKLYQYCNIEEIQDFIETTNTVKAVHASLNFQIDHVNNVINISGIANNQNQIDRVLSSFKTAIQNHMSISEIPWTLSPDITINNHASSIDFSITTTLLFSAIGNIKLTDILIENKQITIRGLVRDIDRKNETNNLLEQLFSDEFTIIDELEIVIKHQPKLPSFQIEKLSPPHIEKPNQN